MASLLRLGSRDKHLGRDEARPGIEEHVRVLKTGTGIEDRRQQEVDAPVKWLAFDVVTAWRVFSLERNALDEPETPPAKDLTDGEREVVGMALQAGGHRSRAHFRVTKCFGALTCKCKAWCASCRPRMLPDDSSAKCDVVLTDRNGSVSIVYNRKPASES